MGIRQSWRAENVCKTFALRLSRFESYYSHNKQYLDVAQLIERFYAGGRRFKSCYPDKIEMTIWVRPSLAVLGLIILVYGFESLHFDKLIRVSCRWLNFPALDVGVREFESHHSDYKRKSTFLSY
jgi:hypothetical protein